ncbi:hypothetical protein GJ496_008703 [Pomphorhynchus laevis]|nr:hypothetical protein GJ496_008703 [Pomphorhynchus laevis]
MSGKEYRVCNSIQEMECYVLQVLNTLDWNRIALVPDRFLHNMQIGFKLIIAENAKEIRILSLYCSTVNFSNHTDYNSNVNNKRYFRNATKLKIDGRCPKFRIDSNYAQYAVDTNKIETHNDPSGKAFHNSKRYSLNIENKNPNAEFVSSKTVINRVAYHTCHEEQRTSTMKTIDPFLVYLQEKPNSIFTNGDHIIYVEEIDDGSSSLYGTHSNAFRKTIKSISLKTNQLCSCSIAAISHVCFLILTAINRITDLVSQYIISEQISQSLRC